MALPIDELSPDLPPGLIWGFAGADGAVRRLEGEGGGVALTGAPDEFRWLHFNLTDLRGHAWIRRAAADAPPAMLDLLLSRDPLPRGLAEGGFVGMVLSDFERDFEGEDTGRLAALHILVGPRWMITGRHSILRAPDAMRGRLAGGSPLDGPDQALEAALAGLTDAWGRSVGGVSAALAELEAAFFAEDRAPEMRELIGLRRQAARAHRVIGLLRSVLHQISGQAGLPDVLGPAVSRGLTRLRGLDADVIAAQNQLKLLRDELELQAAQRSNQNIYLLSVMSALMLPATLVTGFFGMNTGGLPFAHGEGTLAAGLIAIGCSGGTYLVLRLMGLVRGG